jgi:ATP-dependent Clp protease adaptor protein ClpS
MGISNSVLRSVDWVVEAKSKLEAKKPNRYKVILYNDDYTPMDFVVFVVQSFFEKSFEEATSLMLVVHTKGQAVCGEYTYDIAETKVAEVMDCAAKHQHPLKCDMKVA